MDTNPQYRAKTDPKTDSTVSYDTEIRNSGSSSTGWAPSSAFLNPIDAAILKDISEESTVW